MYGIQYTAINAGIVPYLERSARSVRKHSPDLKICVVTDQSRDSLANVPYDDYIKVPSRIVEIGDRPAYPDQGFYGKVKYFYNSPYEYTLFLDHDTYILDDIRDIFKMLEEGNFDIAMAHEIGRFSHSPHNQDIPYSYMIFNTGVVAYRKSERMKRIAGEWWRVMMEMGDAWGDQEALMRVLYKDGEVRIATLPREWNFRFFFPQTAFQKVKILHGRGENMEEVGRRVNEKVNIGRWWCGEKRYGWFDHTEGKMKME